MNSGMKLALGGTVVLLAAVGIELAVIHHRNNEEAPVKVVEVAKLNPDDAVYPRKLRQDSMKDMKAMVGTTVWMSAGGQMDYYVDKGNHVDYSKPLGTVPGATEMKIVGVFEQVAPRTGRAVFRIAAGQRHVLLAFTMPKGTDPKAVYAFPVGNYDNGAYTIYADDILFYDDPHVLYKHWGPEMWAQVDQHKAVLGMSEAEAMMSLGEVTKPSSDDRGNRSVVFENDGHALTIVFRNDKAVSITPGGSL
ncbi:MAG: hypothetical protein V4555_06940 [Acidobacteriota bacterium]